MNGRTRRKTKAGQTEARKKSRANHSRKLRKPEIGPPRLSVELIPTHQSNLNLHYFLIDEDWRRLRKGVIDAAQGVCQICGAHTRKLECHHSWKFDDEEKTQTLVALLAICRLCHLAKHIGQQEWAGVDYVEAEAHLTNVNGWSPRETRRYVKESWAMCGKRGRHAYQVDLSYIDQFGLMPTPDYDSLYLGAAEDDSDAEITSLAKIATKESRHWKWIAIHRGKHGSGHALFELATVEPCTRSRKEIDFLVSSFMRMRHKHGSPIGIYGSGTPESRFLGDMKAWLMRRDLRTNKKSKPQGSFGRARPK
jgi:hypothetical protein